MDSRILTTTVETAVFYLQHGIRMEAWTFISMHDVAWMRFLFGLYIILALSWLFLNMLWRIRLALKIPAQMQAIYPFRHLLRL